jgi:hypothetical protein
MVLDFRRGGAVGQEQALVAAVIGVAHCRVDADIGGDAGQHDVADTFGLQHEIEVGGEERPLPGLSMIGSPATG